MASVIPSVFKGGSEREWWWGLLQQAARGKHIILPANVRRNSLEDRFTLVHTPRLMEWPIGQDLNKIKMRKLVARRAGKGYVHRLH